MSQSISWYAPRTSAVLPTPCLPSAAIVRTLWVAMKSFLLQGRSRSWLANVPRAVPLCLLLFLADTFLFLFIFLHKLVPFNSCPRSRPRFRPREKALPPRPGLPIFTPVLSLVLTRERLSFLLLSATVLQQFVRLYLWYKSFGAWF